MYGWIEKEAVKESGINCIKLYELWVSNEPDVIGQLFLKKNDGNWWFKIFYDKESNAALMETDDFVEAQAQAIEYTINYLQTGIKDIREQLNVLTRDKESGYRCPECNGALHYYIGRKTTSYYKILHNGKIVNEAFSDVPWGLIRKGIECSCCKREQGVNYFSSNNDSEAFKETVAEIVQINQLGDEVNPE